MKPDAAVAAQVDAIPLRCDVGEEIYTSWATCITEASHGIAWGVKGGLRKVALLCDKHNDVMMRNNQSLIRMSVRLSKSDPKGIVQ